jgi:hypothetical protein
VSLALVQGGCITEADRAELQPPGSITPLLGRDDIDAAI